jgi:phosphate transport system protein
MPAIPQLTPLRNNLVTYARFVEEMISKSREALIDRRRDLLDDIIGHDETRANESEMDLEAEGTSLIAQHQPMARDLRTVLMILHITTDLERMADHAVNIAEAAQGLLERSPVTAPAAMNRMADATTRMVGESIRAFIGGDAALAVKVCEGDDTVDSLADEILIEMTTSMERDPSRIEGSLAVLKIAGNLERIADLSTNICEDVIYMAEGRVIKHHFTEGAEEGA